MKSSSLARIRERISVASAEAEQTLRQQLARSLAADPIEGLLDDHIQIVPYVTGTNSRRSDKELAKMLELIDNLPISESGKDGRA